MKCVAPKWLTHSVDYRMMPGQRSKSLPARPSALWAELGSVSFLTLLPVSMTVRGTQQTCNASTIYNGKSKRMKSLLAKRL